MAVLHTFWVLIAFYALRIGAIEDYCSQNTFNNGFTGMHFTKEATNEEFAVVGKFKGLHCCAKGYTSIEWYKDGRPYPWGLELSSLIIFSDSANQTIYAQNIKDDDAGNYTCVLRNDRGNETETHTHTINLRVFDKLPDDPKITYVSGDNEAHVGDMRRLFCEAFGGRINLPDAHSEAVWFLELSNGSLIEIPNHISQKKVSREDDQTVGTYLTFTNIKPDDFGTYTCIISKPGNSIKKHVTIREKMKAVEYINPNPFPLKEILIISAVAILFLTTVLLLVKQYGLRVQVILKDTYGSVEENDGKTSDVLVAYAPKDSELARGVMIHNLNQKGYQCEAREMKPNISDWPTELSEQAQLTRRVIAIISPAALGDSWASSHLLQALKQLQTLKTPRLICVALKELPASQNETKNSQGETLASVVKTMNLILWERSNDARFWLSLCRELPAKRGRGAVAAEANNQTRPRLTSERSFDNLVLV